MEYVGIEQERIRDYLKRSEDECDFEKWLSNIDPNVSLVLAEGFEERSLGIIEKLVHAGIKVSTVIIGRYVKNLELNKKYRPRLEKLASIVAPNKWHVIENLNDGLWVREAIELLNTDTVLLDITAISNRGLFGALDAAIMSGRKIFIVYSEAGEYWPKKTDWQKLKKELYGNESIAEVVDKMPWLFGYEHRVELVPGHEGYDSTDCGRALIGFLPFKCARLAAILSQENYAEIIFIAGRPRLEENLWRLETLREINDPITKDWCVVEMSTFSYRNAFQQLSSLLLQNESLLLKHDVHMAILGSKLQTVACWALSSILKSLTIVTSIPAQYYPESFSDGIGTSWAFRLTSQ